MGFLRQLFRKIKALRDIRYWFLYRFHTSHRYDVVHTGLSYGYYEVDKRLLHANFALLKGFVEVELAWMSLVCNKDERAKVPWYMTLAQYHRRHYLELALAYLTYWDNADNNKVEQLWEGELEGIRSKDREIRELYQWWVEARPKRIDPYQDCPDDQLMKAFEQEEAYHKEDEEMLIRLVKIRRNLWT